MNISMRHVLLNLVGFTLFVSPAAASDWRQFRGNDANSVSADANVPTELSGEKIAWTAALPGRGVSGPIAVAGRVLLTASSGYAQDRLHVICLDAASGDEMWQRQFQATGRTMCHSKMAVATPTPASDGERIFAFYSSNDLICMDLQGQLLWYRPLGSQFPNASNSLGMSSSPIVVGSTVVVQVESDAESFAAGIDAETGQTRWILDDRPQRANWTSPSILRGTDGRPDLVLLQSSQGLSAVDAATGKVAWEFTNGASTIPSTTVSGNLVVIPSNGLTAIRPVGDGSQFEEAWQASGIRPGTASPLIYEGRAYAVGRGGILTCGDAATGDRLWQLRLRDEFSGTPVAAAGHLFIWNESGMGFVVKPGEEDGEIVSEMDFGQTILSSPAIADDAIYIRSDETLWKLANQN